MNYEDRIRQERPMMSKSFARLADFLLDSYVESAFMTASELAQTLSLDAATVVRFSQALGYSGFPRLQREIRQRVKDDLLIRPEQAAKNNTTTGIVNEAMQDIMHALDQTRMSLEISALEQLVNALGSARRITILPEGPAQSSAYSLVLFLEQGGFPIYIARTSMIDLARTVHIATNQDLLISMEVAGRSPYIARAMEEANQKGIRTAAIVAAASMPSARYASVVVSAQSHPSTEIGIITMDAIVYTLARVLYARFADRFAGTEQAINTLTERLQIPIE